MGVWGVEMNKRQVTSDKKQVKENKMKEQTIKEKKHKVFKVLYIINLVIILFLLIYSAIITIIKIITIEMFMFGFFGLTILLSPLLITFLILNIYGYNINKNNHLKYILILIPLIIWLIFGIVSFCIWAKNGFMLP